MTGTEKKKGRPPIAAKDRKRSNLTFRVRSQDRDRLAAEAAAAGRSISEEIEYRVFTSHQSDENFRLAFSGDHNVTLIRAILSAAWMVEARTGKSWIVDEDASAELHQAIWEIFHGIKMGGLSADQAVDLGFSAASRWLGDILEDKDHPDRPRDLRIQGHATAMIVLRQFRLVPSDEELKVAFDRGVARRPTAAEAQDAIEPGDRQ